MVLGQDPQFQELCPKIDSQASAMFNHGKNAWLKTSDSGTHAWWEHRSTPGHNAIGQTQVRIAVSTCHLRQPRMVLLGGLTAVSSDVLA